MNVIFLCIAFNQVILMFIDSFKQIVRYADVNSTILFACQYVDKVLFHHSTLDSRLRGNDSFAGWATAHAAFYHRPTWFIALAIRRTTSKPSHIFSWLIAPNATASLCIALYIRIACL